MVMAFTCSCLAQNTSNDKAISQSATYTLKGIFPTSLNGKKVTLYAHLDDPRTTESTVVRDGKFILTGPLESPSLARLVVSGGLFVENVTFVLEEGETTFTYVNNSLLVKGGKRTTIYLAHEETTKKLFNDQDRYLKYLASFLKKNNDNIIGAHFYSTFGGGPLSERERAELLATASEEFLNYPLFKEYQERKKAMERQMAGVTFTDFELPDKDGKIHKLSEYVGKGQYVFVNFWNGKIPNDRSEMLNMRAVYEKYHEKGFDIVSVSTEKDRNSWLKAINEMSLPWHQLHDPQGAAGVFSQVYGGNSSLTLFIEPDSIITANNLSGSLLEDKLEDVFGILTPGSGVLFNDGKSFDDILYMAKRDNKMVFLACNDPSSEGTQMMNGKEFLKKEAGNFFNNKFVCWQIDATDKQNIELVYRYDINEAPTYLLLDNNGNHLGRVVGGTDITRFIWMVQDELQDDEGLAWYQRQFNDGERDKQFLYDYLELAEEYYMKNTAKKIAAALLDGKNAEQVACDKELFEVFKRGHFMLNDKWFTLLYQEREAVQRHQGEGAVREMNELWKEGTKSCLLFKDGSYQGIDANFLQVYKQTMKEYGVPQADILRNERWVLILNASYSRNYSEMVKLLKNDLKQGGTLFNDPSVIDALQELMSNCQDPKVLKTVEKWIAGT